MKHASFFTGIGGFDLAAELVGWDNIFQVENDKHCIKFNNKNFPKVKKYGDIKQFDPTPYTNKIDVISGGFPCQPFSNAGLKHGAQDHRYLWPEYFRCITAIQPTWIVSENVPGIVNMELPKILADLETQGYQSEVFIIPAHAIGALHIRKRVWIISYSYKNDMRRKPRKISDTPAKTERKAYKWQRMRTQFSYFHQNVPHSTCKRKQKNLKNSISKLSYKNGINWSFISNSHYTNGQKQCWKIAIQKKLIATRCNSWWKTEPPVGRVVNGLPGRLAQLAGLGNAIVPGIAYKLFQFINQTYKD